MDCLKSKEKLGTSDLLLLEDVPDIVSQERDKDNQLDKSAMDDQLTPKLNTPATNLLHHCLPVTNLRLLEGIVLVATEGPSLLVKMAYFEKDSFQRFQLFPSQYIISGVDFLPHPVIECEGNPVDWYKRTDKPYDYIYVGFIWAGSVGTIIRITRSKKGQLKLLEYDESVDKCSNELINLSFIPVAAKWLKRGNMLALLSVLNYVVFYERRKNNDESDSRNLTSLKEISQVKCSKSETLFSGKIFENVGGDIRIFAGTIFNGICVWDIVGDEAVIKHELKCHDGIIFSVDYFQAKRLLLSTSDDRTVAVWKFTDADQVSLLHRFYGHDARVWKALSVRGYILSVGESSDVQINILEDGSLHKSWRAHDDSPVFTCTYDNDFEILYTGGSDGSIRKWPKWWYQLKPRILPFDVIPVDTETDHKSKIQGSGRWKENKDFPRMIALLDINHVLVSMDSGRIAALTWDGTQFDLLHDEKCEGYSNIKISPDHKTLAVAGNDGHFYTAQLTFSENRSSKSTVLYAKKLFQTRVSGNILSMIWVSSSRILLICLNRAIAIIFQEDRNGERTEAQLIQPFNLNFQRPSVPAAVEVKGKYVVLGDEQGTIHLYRYHKANDPIQKFQNCHKDGITSLLYHDSKLYTSGKDGKIRLFRIDINRDDDLKAEFVPLALYNMPFDWINGIYANMGQLLVCGFYKEDFVVHSFNERRTLAKIPCSGGGSRKWDFKYGHGANGSPNASFAFLKDKEIFYTFLPMTGYLNTVIKEGLHSRTINCAVQLQNNPGDSQNLNSYITGSEDGTLKWFQWNMNNNRLLSIQNMENHVSSVRCAWKMTLNGTTIGETKTFLFTGGGRSQLCICEIDGDRIGLLKDIILVKTSCKQTEGDVRIMDISVIQLNCVDELWCFGACSDGFVRVLCFNAKTHKFKIVGILKGNDHAVMKIQILQSAYLQDAVIICGVTSNGYLIMWTWSKINGPLNQEKVKVTPIEIIPLFTKLLRRTAFHSMKIVECEHGSKYFIVCGGDDCSISLWTLTLNTNPENLIDFEIVESWTRDQTQRGAVVRVEILDDTVYSISNDQIVAFWDINGDLKRKVYAGVSDCQGFLVDWKNKCILCYGKGVSWVPIV